MSDKPRTKGTAEQAVLDAAAYTIAEAAHHLRLPEATVRSWILGRPYPTAGGMRRFAPVIAIPDPRAGLLSFRNLVELHVLSAIRRKHKVRLSQVRSAVLFLQRHFNEGHPLADQQMSTDGKDLFIDELGRLINASRLGQLEMKALLGDYLRRIDRDPKGIAVRLYPFFGKPENRVVVIDPRVKFGKPCIAGTGIRTDIIAERFAAGDTIDEIADDYGRERREIEEAIRFEKAA